MRSCRATTHADLATLVEPVTTPYYCAKHGKICKPLFSILKWWETYSKDTVKRLAQFDKLFGYSHTGRAFLYNFLFVPHKSISLSISNENYSIN